MIISVSRRTDIPAFYSEWFMEKVKEGNCITQNPYNPHQKKIISLKCEDVSAFVFWSKYPKSLMSELGKLDKIGYRYYFQFTLNNYPFELEQNIPNLKKRIDCFKKLSDKLGPDRVVWRYDPIIISNKTSFSFHVEKFNQIAESLTGYTKTVMTSFLTIYKKTKRHLNYLKKDGYIFEEDSMNLTGSDLLINTMANICNDYGMKIYTCSMDRDYSKFGVHHGNCISTELVNRLWNLNYPIYKDKGQRKECGCTVSKDIGINNSCKHYCLYCYATQKHHLPD